MISRHTLLMDINWLLETQIRHLKESEKTTNQTKQVLKKQKGEANISSNGSDDDATVLGCKK